MPYALRVRILFLLLPLVSVLAQDAMDAGSRFKRGEEYLQSKNWSEAIKEFESAVSLKPDWTEAYFKLGIAHSKVPVTTDQITTKPP